MTDLLPLQWLRFRDNVVDNWIWFRDRVELYLADTESLKLGEQQSNAPNTSILLHLAGQEETDIYNTFNLTEEDNNYKSVQAFEAYCQLQSNGTFERCRHSPMGTECGC